MTTGQYLQWGGVLLLWIGGIWSILRSGRIADPVRRRNARTLGWLLMAVGALLFVVAYAAYYYS